MRLRFRTLTLLLLATVAGPTRALPEASLRPLAAGLELPVTVVAAPGDDGTLYVLEQAGRIRTVAAADGAIAAEPWLDLSPASGSGLTCAAGERGLLGLAFHPAFAENGWLFLNYTSATPNCGNDAPFHTVIARFTVVDGAPDVDSRVDVLKIPQPLSNHNAGDLHFGPDGYLYVATGDGGGAGDPRDNAQDTGSLLGKLLRLDVDAAGGAGAGNACGDAEHYAIPADNPFVGGGPADDTCAEIWALGLRNPYRFSFDPASGALWIGDVGQFQREEINRVPIGPGGGAGGLNFGWDCREGTLVYGAQPGDRDAPSSACAALRDEALTAPLLQYAHVGSRSSVTGGRVFRGPIPLLRGVYVAADFVSGELFLAEEGPDGWTAAFAPGAGVFSLAGFGADGAGRLYVVDRGNGRLLRVGSPEHVFFGGFERAGLR